MSQWFLTCLYYNGRGEVTEMVLVWYTPVCYVPVHYAPVRYDPVRYTPMFLRPICFIPEVPGSFHPWKNTLSLKVSLFCPWIFLLCELMIPVSFQIYLIPLTQFFFRWFLMVLEYSLIGEKFPLITAPCTLYTVKKKIENFSRLWNFF